MGIDGIWWGYYPPVSSTMVNSGNSSEWVNDDEHGGWPFVDRMLTVYYTSCPNLTGLVKYEATVVILARSRQEESWAPKSHRKCSTQFPGKQGSSWLATLKLERLGSWPCFQATRSKRAKYHLATPGRFATFQQNHDNSILAWIGSWVSTLNNG